MEILQGKNHYKESKDRQTGSNIFSLYQTELISLLKKEGRVLGEWPARSLDRKEGKGQRT